MVTARVLDRSFDLLADAVKVEWSRHEHVVLWVERTAAVMGVSTPEVVDLAVLLAIRDAQLTGVPSERDPLGSEGLPMNEEEAREWQRRTLSTIVGIARSEPLWAAWAGRDGSELAALLG
jgi:hypothetical protein